jgi:hypothetical protein
VKRRNVEARVRRVGVVFAVAAAALVAGVQQAAAEPPLKFSDPDVRASMQRAIDFLLRDQNADGSWGSHRNASDEFWSNPETHRSWTVATTGLACMALSQSSPTESPGAVRTETIERAYDRGIDYVVKNADLKRPSDWDVDNTWGYVYGLQILARAYREPRYQGTPRQQEIRKAADLILDKLAKCQTPSGGWGYYDFDATTHPGSWATSFMTAVGVLAMVEAKECGFTVEEKMLGAAVKALRRCRLPSGAYTYSVDAVPSPGGAEWIDQVKGSLGRIQVCNLARLRAGDPISADELEKGLGYFFKEHRFLDIARKRPIPHEAYYLNAGYFYFFGHYYAAGVIEQLPGDRQAKWWPKLQREIIKTQEKDGSMWDYYIHSYHRPYGASFGLMTLAHSLGMADRLEPALPASTQPAR